MFTFVRKGLFTMDYQIRPALKTDMPAVLRLIQQLATYEKEPDAVEITVEDLENDGFGPHPIFKCHVLEKDQEVVGIALFYFRYSTWKGKTIHLEDLVIDLHHRHRGYGEALLKSVIAYAATQKVRRVEWAVLDWNTPAMKLYEKMGASILEDWNIVQMDRTQYLKVLK